MPQNIENDPVEGAVPLSPQPMMSRAEFEAHRMLSMPLEQARSYQNARIDINTPKVIAAATFVYGGKQFSITPTAQFNTHVMWTRRNEVGFAYPVVRSTKDSLSSVSLPDAAAVEAFYTASENAVRAFLDEGNALKAQVNALATVAEVAAFVDPR